MAPRETENNAYAKFWGDKQRTLWYVMVFLEWSIVIESLSQGTVPSEWKYAKITPLYKKGMSTDMDNYRPSNFGFTSCVQSVGEGCTSSTT